MKPCDRWRDELADHVAGALASPALAAHLEQCPACASAARAWRARMQEIDAGLRQWGAAEASADAVPRILAGVRAQASRRVWFPEWKTVAAGVLALAILAFSAVYVRRATQKREETSQILYAAATIANWKSPTQGLLRPPDDSWSKAPPQLGRFFFQWEADTIKKEAESR